jgi:hypothetical protein
LKAVETSAPLQEEATSAIPASQNHRDALLALAVSYTNDLYKGKRDI